MLDKSMSPTTDSEREQVVQQVNKMFGGAIVKQHGALFTSYAQVVTFYAQHVSTIGWIAKQVGPSISLAHSLLGRMMHAPSAESFQNLKRICKYLSGQKDMCIHLRPQATYTWGELDIE